MKTCKDCKWYYISCIDMCGLTPEECIDFEQRTNFDKVTESPEALADAVYHFLFGRIYCEGRVCEDVNGDCERCFLNWLKQEAEDEK